jgi:hypothetical protein
MNYAEFNTKETKMLKPINNKKITDKPNTFITIYPIFQCGCNDPQISTTNDENKSQSCYNCKRTWNAPK